MPFSLPPTKNEIEISEEPNLPNVVEYNDGGNEDPSKRPVGRQHLTNENELND